VTRSLVLEVLDGVTDPCSVTAGLPAGLVDMGLVQEVRISSPDAPACTGYADVRVVLRLTNGLCMLGAVLAAEARERLTRVPGVASAEVTIDTSHVWREADMGADYRRRLRSHRERRP
jgi:metal-sulfur cluster biosynthetic enzyme